MNVPSVSLGESLPDTKEAAPGVLCPALGILNQEDGEETGEATEIEAKSTRPPQRERGIWVCLVQQTV